MVLSSPVTHAFVQNLFIDIDFSIFEGRDLSRVPEALDTYKVGISYNFEHERWVGLWHGLMIQAVWEAVMTVSHFLECYHLDRFQGTDSEKQLEDAALEREGNRTYLGGVVFLDVDDDDIGPSEHVKYKIRSASYDVQDTNILKPA